MNWSSNGWSANAHKRSDGQWAWKVTQAEPFDMRHGVVATLQLARKAVGDAASTIVEARVRR